VFNSEPKVKQSQEPDRIAAISCRNTGYVRSRSLLYSFEDFAEDMSLATIVSPSAPYLNRVHSRLVRHIYHYSPAVARGVVLREPGHIGNDVRLISCQSLTELPLFLPFFDKRESTGKTACFMEEVWVSDIPRYPLAIELLRACDVIFVGCHGAVAAVAAATGKPTFHLPPSVDAMASNPFSGSPKQRSIDLYYMGRRQPELHAGLSAWSASSGSFYLYDTAGNAVMADHREHRRHLTDLIQRSRFFIVAPGKSAGDGMLATPQDEVGGRYYEGASCGTIMIGTDNRSTILQQNFPYDNAVIPFDGSCERLLELMNSLSKDEAHLDRIRREGVANALRRHDFAHRWKTILQALGRPEPISLARKLAQLNQAADDVMRPARAGAASALA